MRFLAVALIFFGVAASHAQTPEVPHKMHFADMTLTIRDDARREIQKDVDALTQHPRYFNVKVERAKTYFPIIEKIFQEERLPDDFKYLALQESALISDAVSVSNAVGFWQFKDFTAMEMGMRVDNEIDERMNIYSATRGAARYLKKNNYLFNNWLLALQSYQMGGGGVQRSMGDEYNGARHMEITSDTYWYVKKFLAHKVAYENLIKGDPQVKVIQFQTQSPKTMPQLAAELSIDEATLKEYNKWVRADKIPADKSYSVIVPSGQLTPEFNVLVLASTKGSKAEPIETKAEVEKKKINDVLAIKAKAGETTITLADRGGVSLTDFLKYNEIAVNHQILSGAYYFLQKKKLKSEQLNHTVKPNENLWVISQQYGMQLKRLKKLNRISDTSDLKAGEVVWLNTKRPVQESTLQPVLAEEVEVAVVDDDSFFGWEVKPKEGFNSKKNDVNPIAAEVPIIRSDSLVAPTPRLQNDMHQVKPGETLYAISKMYGVSVMDLLTWNQLDINAGLSPGQQLKIAAPVQNTGTENTIRESKTTPTFIVYEVKPSDTLYSVAREYNVTIKELMDWNQKETLSLAQGEKLRILAR
jgi:membrane-bound lytic murein transglycosylase D